ncbi:BTB/POZ domain-containing protein 9-like [Saccoglossus kowalevskii]|uniref:BTB/POZ domain-containing protein 9 n=1 Tax=Saccoglossus kowalevskii TaxID=10224 RepID=A0ABM0GM68_SACKO|nr:PREDICTED: BTB/POZ domain-containing protein 9-like [Saccoglossus kowalevskii]
MCDSHSLRPHTPVGEVEHVHHLSEQIGNLFLSEEYSDITFIVEDKRFYAHRVILAARCEYFRALLFGGMRESRPDCTEIELKDTTPVAFCALLKYIYTGRMNLQDLKDDALLDVLGLAHRYGFTDLEMSISDYLRATLNIHNVCLIYDVASLYQLRSLKDTCCSFMDNNAAEVMSSEAFLALSESALREVISRDSFCAVEIDIFRAVLSWSEMNSDIDPTHIVSAVRLQLMSLPELLNIVRPTNLVSPDSILDAIKLTSESKASDLPFRGFLSLEENVACMKHGGHVTHGEMPSALLDGDISNYDLDRGFTRHTIEEPCGKNSIVVKLGKACIINTIKLLLWDRDTRSYSYYIEISMDEEDWVRIVDHSRYMCRSWQTLYFDPRVAKYIRIVGVHNTVNKVFHLVSFECYYTARPFTLENGLIVPTENVATVHASACVIEGVSRSRNALLNGDTKNYDWDSGYTCHQLGSGAIIVQLAQPFVISSCRLLLWDCDDRSYSYYIEISTDQHNWTRIADKTREPCKSWQTVFFEKKTVTFIKIVGTHNTANEVFHCVHFECPAQLNGQGQDELSTSSAASAAATQTDGSSGSGLQGAVAGPPLPPFPNQLFPGPGMPPFHRYMPGAGDGMNRF